MLPAFREIHADLGFTEYGITTLSIVIEISALKVNVDYYIEREREIQNKIKRYSIIILLYIFQHSLYTLARASSPILHLLVATPRNPVSTTVVLLSLPLFV